MRQALSPALPVAGRADVGGAAGAVHTPAARTSAGTSAGTAELRARRTTSATSAKLPELSVVVPTYRRPALLLTNLHALAQQTLAPQRYEIIVVDDGHDDATRTAVRAMAQEHPALQLSYMRPPSGRGPAVARNTGWRVARAPVIAFTDDDTVPLADWLAEGLAAMQPALAVDADTDTDVGADAGKATRNPTASNGTALSPPAFAPVALAGRVIVPRAADAAPPTDHELMTRGLETASFVTANAFVRRSALQRIGGFDEQFRRAWREDSDLEFRLRNIGTVGRAPRAAVLHPVRPERWGVSLRQQQNAFYDALLYRKHPQQYRQHCHAQPPWDYLVIVAATLAAPLLLAAGAAQAAAVSAGLALVLVLRFAWRRLRHTSRSGRHVVEMLVTSLAIPYLSVYWRLRGAWHFRVRFL